MSSTDLETTKSLLHFDDFPKDEIGLETWTAQNSNAKSSETIKFGRGSLYTNSGALYCTNNTGIWNLNSSENYEIEFFVYAVKHSGTRYLFRLMENGNSSPILLLSLTTSGYLEFTATGWNITDAITGSTALTIKTWYHVLIRVSNQTLKVFLDGTEEISADLPENITLAVAQVRLGYFTSTGYIDEFVFRHSAGSGNPIVPTEPYYLSSQRDFWGDVKSLLHFDDLLKDEIGIEAWSKSKAAVVSGDIVKFGHGSLYPNTGYLTGTNNTGIWCLNSNGDYEIEFFVYPVAHDGTRYLFRLHTGSSILLNLSLNSNGTINFSCSNWGCSGVNGTTILAVNEWHHIMLRISNQTAKVFLDGAEEISTALSKAYIKLTAVTKILLGYFNSETYAYYMDEFLFRHSASTETPTVPTLPYSFCAYKSHTKRNFGTIKSLLHFDYPYFNEPNDGLGDEIGLETWTKSSTNVKLYGSAIPKAGTLAPKFGYRCLYTLNAYAYCNNESGTWNLASQGKYEIGMFVYITQTANDKSIFSLMDTEKTNAIFKLSSSAGGLLSFVSSGFGVETISGTTEITINTWHHIFMRISKKKINIYLDGNLEISAELPSNTELTVGQVRIGNDTTSYPVYIDEFMFRHNADKANPAIPTEPYNGYLDRNNIGGYGTGLDGDVVISENTQINSYGLIHTIIDSRTIIITSWNNGAVIPDIDSEIMIHITAPKSTASADYPLAGLYSFAKIHAINENVIILDRDITTESGDDFTLNSNIPSMYYVQAITVPNYSSLTINSGCTVNPLSWNNTKGGGIVAFRCTGDCTVNGSIITLGKGAVRYDFHQMTHSKLIDRFLIASGGGIFITCGGTFTASSTARLGATWSGLGDGSNGAAGYGGNGGSIKLLGNASASGGAGGVGGGGGGAVGVFDKVAAGGAVGSGGGSSEGRICSGGGGCGGKGGGCASNVAGEVTGGGGGGGQGNSGGAGGTITHNTGSYNTATYNLNGYAGTINGGSGRTTTAGIYPSGSGGGAPGGNNAGACILLACNKLKADASAISTGGMVGRSVSETREGDRYGIAGDGGGGTGFCYIAAEEFIDE